MNPSLEQSKNLLDSISPSFCLAKWNQATLHLFNGHTQSCHHVNSHSVDLNAIKLDPSKLHNTSKKVAARKKMMLGSRPAECSYCWKMEDAGQTSDRVFKSRENWALPDLDSIAKNPLDRSTPPRYLEVAFDNICNFKCLYCSPSYSSSWRAEIEKWGAYPTSRRYNNLIAPRIKGLLPKENASQQQLRDAFWEWWPQLKQHLHYLRVTGGEPLLSKETWKMFELLASDVLKDLHFAINSNLGVPEKLIIDLTNKINNVTDRLKSFTLYASIDTFGPQAEYIRHGLNEKQFWKNVEVILSSSSRPINLSLMITVNALSLVHLDRLMAKIIELRTTYPNHHIAFDTPYLKNPAHLSIQILPEHFVQYLEAAIAVLKKSPLVAADERVKLERLRPLLKENPWGDFKKSWMRGDFYLMIKECDKRRGLNFEETFPELVDFLNECKKVVKRWPLSQF